MMYQNPASTADIILRREREIKEGHVVSEIVLIQRGREPFYGKWALPGGHIDLGEETCEETAVRELKEETGLIVRVEDLELVGVYSDPKRDPRGHYITHVYTTKKFSGELRAGDDAKDARWFPLYSESEIKALMGCMFRNAFAGRRDSIDRKEITNESLPELAFDHNKILEDYKAKWR